MGQRERTQELQPGDAVGFDQDAELSRLAASFQRNHLELNKLVESQQRLGAELTRDDRELVISLMRAKAELAEAIAHRRATTILGLQVKAAVLLAFTQYDCNGRVHWTDHDELMGWSIARDLLGDEAARPSEVCNGYPPLA